MRFSLRLMLPVIACIALVSGLFAYYQEQDQERALHKELEQRASLAAQSLADNLQPLLDKNSSALELRRALNRFSTRERIVGAAIFDDAGKSIAVTERLPIALEDAFSVLTPKIDPQNPDGQGVFLTLGPRFYHAQMLSMRRADGKAMGLAVFHDAGFIREQSAVIWRQTLIHVSLEVLLIVLITFLIIRWSLMSPISKAAQWLKALRSGKSEIAAPRSELLGPLAREMENVVKSLQEARAAAAREARLREASESLWTSDRLSVHVRKRLQNRRLVVVSNREPYIHTRQNGNLEIMIPASGLVTALEPILRSCDGTWIAQASGDADREAVDEHDRLRVPPAEPQYTLRRVWLDREEEDGYYFGFANEGLWPLCHIAHTRPIFRSENWEHYRQVNRKFADAVLEEIADTQKPFILVQDYHFALLPRMIKKERPDARVAIFWHIPWPNAEAFRNLSLGTRTGRWPAGSRSGRLPHSESLQQFPRDRGPRRGVPHRVGGLHRQLRRTSHGRSPLSHQHRFRRHAPSTTLAHPLHATAPRCWPESACRPSSWAWAWTAWITPRDSGTLSRDRTFPR